MFMDFEKEISSIKERNRRVEGDKAWEKSFFRLFVIMILTYVFAFLLMLWADLDRPWLGAFVPAAGFVISNFTLPPLKKWWINKYYQ